MVRKIPLLHNTKYEHGSGKTAALMRRHYKKTCPISLESFAARTKLNEAAAPRSTIVFELFINILRIKYRTIRQEMDDELKLRIYIEQQKS